MIPSAYWMIESVAKGMPASQRINFTNPRDTFPNNIDNTTLPEIAIIVPGSQLLFNIPIWSVSCRRCSAAISNAVHPLTRHSKHWLQLPLLKAIQPSRKPLAAAKSKSSLPPRVQNYEAHRIAAQREKGCIGIYRATWSSHTPTPSAFFLELVALSVQILPRSFQLII